ncbi:ester cyclase [Haladaptatus caseinilyticus]|uniref:ester cyclase n=1 Tax=Haladaptatus caseinilyticus TaxID=2993314 RepID=UPI00224AAF85|nr:ester cyclase [Haladaptatus caseinilyticus]
MTVTEHTELLRTLYEGVWNGTNPDVADTLVGSEYIIHDREIAEEMRGPKLYKTLADMTREIFPDMMFTIDDMVAEDDEVALRWTMTGTHEGSMFGIAPTGKRVTLTAIEIDRFEDGKLAETWTQSDMLGLIEQLDADPSSK